VIIDNFDFVSVPLTPHKANPPLIVNTNTALALAIAFQPFEPIAGQCRKRWQIRRRVEHIQFPKRLSFDGSEPPHGFPAEKALRIGASKGLDHSS
jgi:hypothetical protein